MTDETLKYFDSTESANLVWWKCAQFSLYGVSNMGVTHAWMEPHKCYYMYIPGDVYPPHPNQTVHLISLKYL